MSSCRTLEDVECNQEKEDTAEARKVAELKGKEDADARKVEEKRQEELEEARKVAELKENEDADLEKAEEKRQKELEEARKVGELKEKEDTEACEKQAHLEAEEAIREADEKKRQEEEDKKQSEAETEAMVRKCKNRRKPVAMKVKGFYPCWGSNKECQEIISMICMYHVS